MDDGIDAFERRKAVVQVADVASHAFHLRRQLGREVRTGAVNLRVQAIENAYVMARYNQLPTGMDADEARTSGNQHVHVMPHFLVRISAAALHSCGGTLAPAKCLDHQVVQWSAERSARRRR